MAQRYARWRHPVRSASLLAISLAVATLTPGVLEAAEAEARGDDTSAAGGLLVAAVVSLLVGLLALAKAHVRGRTPKGQQR